MELLFVTVIAAFIGLAIRYALPGRQSYGITLLPAVDAAVTATKLGAYDFQQKPFEPKSLLVSVERALEHKELTEETHSLRQALSSMSGGASPVFCHNDRVSFGITSKSDSRRSAFTAMSSWRPLVRRTW